MEPVLQLELNKELVLFLSLLFIVAVAYFGFIWHQIRSLKLQRPRYFPLEEHDLPEYLIELFDQAAQRLEEFGFDKLHYQFSKNLLVHDRADKWSLVLYDKNWGIFAEVTEAFSLLDMPGYEISFTSFYEDGSTLLSINGQKHLIFADIPHTRINDPYTAELRELWESHRKIHDFNTNSRKTLPDGQANAEFSRQYMKLQQKFMDAYFFKLIKSNRVTSAGNNEFVITRGHALKTVLKIIAGEKRAAKAQIKSNKLRNKHDSPPAIPVEVEVDAYLRLTSLRQQGSQNFSSKLFVVFASALLSYLLLGLEFSYLSTAIIISVLAIHELGHVAAMRLFNYHDPQLLLLPFTGIKTTEHTPVPATRQIIACLSGPVPGIIIGMSMLHTDLAQTLPWFHEAAMFMLVFNYVNLLPFTPMDGGHVMRLIMIERFPMTKVVFVAMVTIIIFLGATHWNSPVFWTLGLIMLVGLPLQIAESRQVAMLKQKYLDLGDIDKREVLFRVFQYLRRPRYATLDFNTKHKLTSSILDTMGPKNHPGVISTVALMICYVTFLFFTPPLTAFAVNNDQGLSQLSASNNKPVVKNRAHMNIDWDKKINAATSDNAKFDLLIKGAAHLILQKKFSVAEDYLQQANAISRRFRVDDERRANVHETYAYMYRLDGEYEKSIAHIKKAIEHYQNNPDPGNISLAYDFEILANLYQENAQHQLYETAAKRAISLYRNIKSPKAADALFTTQNRLLDFYFVSRNYDEAKQLIEQALSNVATAGIDSNYLNHRYQLDLAWLDLRQEQIPNALEKLNLSLKNYEIYEQNRNLGAEQLGKSEIYLSMAYGYTKVDNPTEVENYIGISRRYLAEHNKQTLEQLLNSGLENQNLKNTRFQARLSEFTRILNQTKD